MKNIIVYRFPSDEHYRAALFIDSARWSGGWTHDHERAAIERAQALLTNPEHEPERIVEATAMGLQMIAVRLMASGELPTENCGDPDCPVHGAGGTLAQGGLDLNNAFGVEDSTP